MEPTLFTPRLKLTLVTTVGRDSPEFQWLHLLRSNEDVMFWSLSGRSKNEDDTERSIKNYSTIRDEDAGLYRVVYAVHEMLQPYNGASESAQIDNHENLPSHFVGLVNLFSLAPHDLALPEHLGTPASLGSSVVTMTIAYSILPAAWGKGYAPEAVNAVLGACARARAFWLPYEKVYVRSIVNQQNPRSQRVMGKCGMERRGVYEWSGDPVFIAGAWRSTDTLVIYGKLVME